MAFQMNLWKIDSNKLAEIDKAKLDSENRLEDWLVNDPSLLGIELFIIGRQVSTVNRGRIDLLAVDRQGDLLIIELKRDRTPREVIAQILDYASWVRNLDYEEISAIASDYLKESLPEAFRKHFDEPLPENVNTAHSMIIVASEFDESSERIVQYLADEYRVNINVIFFTFFKQADNEFIGRAWLRDPEQVQEISKTRKRSPWSGYWFVNVGEGKHRNWDDNRRYGYMGAGQGMKYSRGLKRLKVGDGIFAYMKGLGYVGYGEVIQEAVMIKDFFVEKESKQLLELSLKAPSADENNDNPELSEWVIGVKWLKSYPREEAKTFKGVFANQNVVCELRQPETVEFLEREFEITA
jgi:hypothetical protein